MSALYDRVLAFVDDARAERFEVLALDVFAHQSAQCAPYREYCLSRGRTPQSVSDWREIPAVPMAAFKHAELCCGPSVRTFLSSGTTEGSERRSRHCLPDLRLYHRSAVAGLRRFFFPDAPRMRIASLVHRTADLPDSSLAQMVEWAVEAFGTEDSLYAIGPDGIDFAALIEGLSASQRDGHPLAIFSTTAALVRVLDHCRDRGIAFRLPHGSRIMDTGGNKGAPRPMSRNGLMHAVWACFAIPGYFCVNEYGMTELSSQYYDSVIADRFHGRHRSRRKLAPHWSRVLVVDPATLAPLAPGAPGLLCHFDLANAGTAMAVRSEDIGYEAEDGFQLVGRVAGADARGCSVAAAP